MMATGDARTHVCKWHGCTAEIPKAHYACRAHWWKIPLGLRVRLNRAWQLLRASSQASELNRTASMHGTKRAHVDRQARAEYEAAHNAVQSWIRSQ